MAERAFLTPRSDAFPAPPSTGARPRAAAPATSLSRTRRGGPAKDASSRPGHTATSGEDTATTITTAAAGSEPAAGPRRAWPAGSPATATSTAPRAGRGGRAATPAAKPATAGSARAATARRPAPSTNTGVALDIPASAAPVEAAIAGAPLADDPLADDSLVDDSVADDSLAGEPVAGGWVAGGQPVGPERVGCGSALDTARVAFRWLVAGPHPVSLDVRGLPGLPARAVPLDELNALLLDPGCPRPTRDAVWARLVERARAEGATWTVACVGAALPALVPVAAQLADWFPGDPADLDAAVLTGFLAHLPEVDLDRPGIANRLRWAAYRAGLDAVREALDAPTPRPPRPGSAPPPPPYGHPDLVLARAVADGALTPGEAELIGLTRLEAITLREAARRRGARYQAVKRARARAEQRLLAYLRHQQATDTPAHPASQTHSPTGARPPVSAIRGNRPPVVSPNPPKPRIRGRRNPVPNTPASGSEARRCA